MSNKKITNSDNIFIKGSYDDVREFLDVVQEEVDKKTWVAFCKYYKIDPNSSWEKDDELSYKYKTHWRHHNPDETYECKFVFITNSGTFYMEIF